MLYQCAGPAMCYVRLVAAAAERRHVKPGHVSTSETLQPGTPLTPHHTTLYTTLLTLNNPLNILIQHPPPYLTSTYQRTRSSSLAYMTIQSTKSLSTISQLSRSSRANMKCGSYEVYSPLIFARFCTVFYLSF